MLDCSQVPWVRRLRDATLLTTAAVLLVWIGRAVMPWDKMFPDIVCYWAAGKNLASGHSPYDVSLQTDIQQEYGWDKATHGFGIYDFLPYYYPPWFGLLWVPLVPWGYPAAKLAWFFINVLLALVTGYLLRHAVPGVSPWMPVVLVPFFFFTLVCTLLGQTAILIFFLMALAWRLLEKRRDWSSGMVLAWLTIKPQLAAVLLLAVLLWAVRRQRWGVVQGFLSTLALLCLASTLIVPSWLSEMLSAVRQTPPPTDYFPWIGNAWLLVLKSLGLQRWSLWMLYLAVALPFFVAVLRKALKPGYPLPDLLALSILAAFFVAPYARHYDFPVLLIPLLVLLGGRLPPLAGTALLMALVVVPYVQLLLLVNFKASYHPSVKFLLESTFFWVPLLLTMAWLASGRVGNGLRRSVKLETRLAGAG